MDRNEEEDERKHQCLDGCSQRHRQSTEMNGKVLNRQGKAIQHVPSKRQSPDESLIPASYAFSYKAKWSKSWRLIILVICITEARAKARVDHRKEAASVCSWNNFSSVAYRWRVTAATVQFVNSQSACWCSRCKVRERRDVAREGTGKRASEGSTCHLASAKWPLWIRAFSTKPHTVTSPENQQAFPPNVAFTLCCGRQAMIRVIELAKQTKRCGDGACLVENAGKLPRQHRRQLTTHTHSSLCHRRVKLQEGG